MLATAETALFRRQLRRVENRGGDDRMISSYPTKLESFSNLFQTVLGRQHRILDTKSFHVVGSDASVLTCFVGISGSGILNADESQKGAYDS